MLQMLEKGFYWVGNRIYGPDLRYRADQPNVTTVESVSVPSLQNLETPRTVIRNNYPY